MGMTETSLQQLKITLVEGTAEMGVFQKMLDDHAVTTLVVRVFQGIERGLGETAVAVIKDPSEWIPGFGLPYQNVVLRPVEIGGIGLKKEVVDEIAYINE